MIFRTLATSALISVCSALLFERAARAAPVTIDASVLSGSHASLNGSTNANLTGVTTLDLAPGPFTISTFAETSTGGVYNSVAFLVNANGTVSYAPTLAGVLGGSGTATLAVKGVAVSFASEVPSNAQGVSEFAGPLVPFSLNLLPGSYFYYVLGDTFALGGVYNGFDFTVNADGTFTTTASYVTGSGTDAMDVVGFPIQVSTQIPSTAQNVVEIVSPGGSSYTLNLVPGEWAYAIVSQTFAAGGGYNGFDFTVNPDGTFTTSVGYVTGSGTSVMDVVGLPVHVTTALETPNQRVLDLDVPTSPSYTLNMIPGPWAYTLYTLSESGAGNVGFDFDLAADGTVSVNAATAAYVSTAGVGALDVLGFPVHFRTFAGADSFTLYGQASYSSTSVETVPMIPAGYDILIGNSSYFFSVTADGTVAYDGNVGAALSGAGTTRLSYGITCSGGTDANGVALGPIASGTSVCGGGFVSYLCSASGQWRYVGMACTVGNVPSPPSCACSGGTDANGVALGPIACGTSVCGGGFVSYQCDASAQWQLVGMACTVGNVPSPPSCACSGGTEANGVALGPIACGTSVCGSGFVSYQCDASAQWQLVGMACTVGNVPSPPSCACSGGTDANGVALGPIACGTSVCGGGFVSYQCDPSGQWQYVGMACTLAG